MPPLIIIGSGLAGYTLAREYRKLDASSPILLITADDGGFYSKPMLSNAFAQRRNAAQLVTQSAAQMAAQLGATILTGTRAVRIDTGVRSVETAGGTFGYSKLVLAAGAQPIKLAIEGNAADEVLSVNHVQDYARFRERIDAAGSAARVAILGAGLIGCEFADDLAGAVGLRQLAPGGPGAAREFCHGLCSRILAPAGAPGGEVPAGRQARVTACAGTPRSSA